MGEARVVLVAMAAGMVGATAVALTVLTHPPRGSMRTNVDGDEVPVVLGWSVLVGGAAGLLVLVAWTWGRDGWLPLRTVGPLLAITFAVGWWDDGKGDERPRGFRGHLGALRARTLTGGLVKMAGGAVAGLITMWALMDGLTPVAVWMLGAMTIALSANAVNLFDRAPGRALKVFLIAGVPLAVASPDWRLAAAGLFGAVAACLPLDLGARAMLGDAGANPLGAFLGLGLVLISGGSVSALVVIVALLLALNLASEKWSFSRIIESHRWLARVDHLGRK